MCRWLWGWGALLLLLLGCATGRPAGSRGLRGDIRTPASGMSREDAVPGGGMERGLAQARRSTSGQEVAEPLDAWESEGMGWRDGVGDGSPFAVPMSLDWFQGFLVQAGVPSEALPEDGRALAPEQALGLIPHLLASPVTLGNFGLKRMAAHLLMQVATGGQVVEREELHERMRRFADVLVLRPDGYLVKATTGRALQKVGSVWLDEDGALRIGRFEVGPFYRALGNRLYRVDGSLEVPPGEPAVGVYEPDDGVLLPMAEGAALALVDTVERIT